MEGDQEVELSLVVESEAEMLPVAAVEAVATGAEQPVRRKALFLNPNPKSTYKSPGVPFFPSQHQHASFSDLDSSKVLFRGWTSPLLRWGEWVEKLRPVFCDLWKRSGILEAIEASVYRIKKDPMSILGVSAFWCSETNSFLFPWAEVTVTLEDVMILGGFPVLGEPIRGSLGPECADIEQRIIMEHRNFNRSTSKKADQSAWMRHFIEGQGDELEHVAFLALWLSRFVFPGPPLKTVKQQILPIAIRLSRGIKIALAPAVLACLFRDLRSVKEYLVSDGSQKAEPLVVWAPFHLLQMWIWERFVALRPEKPNVILNGKPRAMLWHDVGRKTETYLVVLVLGSPNGFQWRPYAKSFENSRSSFYKNDGELKQSSTGIDEDFTSFVQCLKSCELVGLDCIEQYLPHRVAVQFGLDQDIPSFVPRANSTWEEAWETYDITTKNVTLYIPSQVLQSDITLRYSIWWKQCMLDCTDAAVKNGIGPACSSLEFNKLQENILAEKKTKKTHALPNKKKRNLQHLSDLPDLSSECMTLKSDFLKSQIPQPTHVEKPWKNTCVMKQQAIVKQHFSVESAEEIIHNSESVESVKEEIREDFDPVEKENNVATRHFKRKNDGELDFDPIFVKKPRRTFLLQDARFNMEDSVQKRMMMKAEESELEMEIKMIKEEISAIEAQAMAIET